MHSNTQQNLQEANALIALVDGIGTELVINPEKFTAEQQQYLVRRYLNAVLARTS
ncbi:TetR family transcriptional regulator C-terminal domain-containing protein [Leptolyngbya sp. FACHB-671]|uniref:TetR family transcriptional regulator C-terminal domain-containing protein n=1 Tax=unclassified Leptolyngbya TaxID=2650499 RepID=UPI0016863E2E|nr:TetR family transcriptional regulator C-terminal domain-containing protein [Leptolyngbya sp. FACHB-541]MBD2066686.1 TetR family transcriptional regulator C-terminal domain-containing protein [Leptolyngbya sp. FACHB-671]